MSCKKTIIISGSTGYLGRRIIQNLRKSKFNILEIKRGTDNNFKWQNDEYLDSLFRNALKKGGILEVIHLATKYEPKPSYSEQVKTNFLLPLRLIEFSIKYNVKRFINVDTFFTNTSKPNLFPRLPSYVLSKSQIKDWFIFFEKKINIINCKIFHVYGPGDSNKKFVNFLLQNLVDGSKKLELSSCKTIRDFIFIDDVISAMEIIIRNDNLKNNYYEIGTGIGTAVKDFCIHMKKTLNSNTELIFGESNLHGDLDSQIADISNLSKLGWNPSYTISDGINAIIKSNLSK